MWNRLNSPTIWRAFFCISSALGLFGCGAEPPKEESKAQPVFHVPALIGKNITEVTSTLGAPTKASEEQKNQPDVDAAYKIYDRNGQFLLVDYRPSDGVVTGLFVGPNEGAVSDSDKAQLLQFGDLKEDDPRYRVEWVRTSERPERYTGVKVLLNVPKVHTITYSVVGYSNVPNGAPPATGEISYTDANGQSQTVVHNRLPWQMTLRVKPNTIISLLASEDGSAHSGAGGHLMAKIAVDSVTAIEGSSYNRPNATITLAYDVGKKEGSDGSTGGANAESGASS